MKSILQFDFLVNKENNTINVKREFAADIDLIWAAWTTPEILDQWWAPRPYESKTRSMDFRPGGRWVYCMISPENEIHWNIFDYENIEFQQKYSGIDAFCDEKGNINPSMPRNRWTNNFIEKGQHTLVDIILVFDTLSELEKLIELGFKEGFTAGMENLDEYIAAQFFLRKQNKQNNKTRVSTYVNFPGNTEEAFLFYKSVFKTEFSGNGIQRFGELPSDPTQSPIAESVKDMVLHVELPLLGNHVLMGTDAPKEMGFTVVQGNNMHIQIEPESREEATRIFNELSKDGEISMTLQDMFWGAYFGSFTDKFGINWMINHQNK